MDFEYLESISLNGYLYNQFDSITSIDKGGFGKIFSARHKLDNTIYAIKVITIKSQKSADTIKELKILAALKHENVVRYHNSWIQQIYDIDVIELGYDCSEASSMSSSNKKLRSSSYSDYVSESNGPGELDENNKHDNELDESSRCKSNESEISNYSYDVCVLFIKMELCECSLMDWLKKRNENPLPLNYKKCAQSFAHQLLKGVAYIHSRKIMHRDIKPANLFLKSDTINLQLKIGDFGLSKFIDYDINDMGNLPTPSLSANIGTRLYNAPEISSKNERTKYNHKCDLFSVGIILMELMVKFTTSSELIRVLTNIINNITFDELIETWPLEAPYVMSLLSIHPEERHEAEFLLKETSCFKEE